MKKFLLWICAAAVATSAMAADRVSLAERITAKTPYPGIEALTRPAPKADIRMSFAKPRHAAKTVEGLHSNDFRKLVLANSNNLAKAPASYTPRIMGSVVYSDDENFEPGLCVIPMTHDGAFQTLIPDVDATYGGVAADGLYYAQSVFNFFGYQFPMVSCYDLSTGEEVGYWFTEGEELAMDLAYNAKDGKIYGIFFGAEGDEENATSYQFLGTIDYQEEAPVITEVCKLDGTWFALAVDAEGDFYGIKAFQMMGQTTNCTLEKIDIEKGKSSRICRLGYQPRYQQSATFDYATGMFYTTAAPADESGRLYQVDMKTKKASLVANYVNSEVVCGIFTLTAPVAEGAPAPASNLVANFPNPSLTGTFSFDIPNETFQETELTGDVDYTVLAAGQSVSGTAKAGETVTKDFTFTDNGNVEFAVVLSNAAGDAPESFITAFIGYDVPDYPKNVTVEEGPQEGYVTLKWQPVTTDIRGVAMPGITYAVFNVEGSTAYSVADNLTSTTCTFKVCEPTDEQGLYRFCVAAVGQDMYSMLYPTDYIPLGAPYENYRETFPGGELTYDLLLQNFAGSAQWGLFTSATLGLADQNGDDGLVGCQASAAGDSTALVSAKISLKDIKEPIFSLWSYTIVGNYGASTNEVKVEISTDGKEYTEVFNKTVAQIGETEGWHQAIVDLSAYKDQVIRFRLTATTRSMAFTIFDNIYCGETIHKDAGVSFYDADATYVPGKPFMVEAQVGNKGVDPIEGVKVTVYVDGEPTETKDVAALEVGKTANVVFNVPTGEMDETYKRVFFAIECEGDEDPSNNGTGYYDVRASLSTLPYVTTLAGTADEKTVTLTWDDPEVSSIEDFEDATSWADAFGDWTFIDGDLSPIGGFQGLDIPGHAAGSALSSFFVFDSSAPGFNASFAAHSGDKYLAALFRYDGGVIDEWAISPALTGEAQVVSFYAKSYSASYPEAIEVLYSTTDKDRQNFVKVTELYPVPDDWTEITAALPEGAKYFAIRAVSEDAFMLMIDDVDFKAATPKEMPAITGYDIYRNNVKVNAAPVEDNTYTDTVEEDGEYTYAVKALYAEGSSRASNRATVQVGTTGIDAVAAAGNVTITTAEGAIVVTGAEGKAVTVAAVDGKTIYAGTAAATTTVAVQPGVYVVKADTTVAKVIVR